METNPHINLIAAIGKNRELGKRGGLVWRIKEDLQRFKQLTMGHPMIAGRKTAESMGKLPGRETIVVTQSGNIDPKFNYAYSTFEAALEKAKELDAAEIFVVGGAEIFKLALPYADRLYLTLIDAEDSEADVFFPEYAMFSKAVAEEEKQTTEGLKYTWVTLEK